MSAVLVSVLPTRASVSLVKLTCATNYGQSGSEPHAGGADSRSATLSVSRMVSPGGAEGQLQEEPPPRSPATSTMFGPSMRSRGSASFSGGGRLLSAEPPPRWMVEPNSLQEVARDGDHLRILQRILYRQPLDDSQQSHWSVPPWLRAPSWLSAHLVQPWEHEEEALRRLAGCARERLGRRDNEHRVVIVHALAYCSRCACFAHKRLGSRFKGQCQLPEGRAAAAVSYRLARLRSGLHPITGLTLDGHS